MELYNNAIGNHSYSNSQPRIARLVTRFPYFQRVYNYGIWIKSILKTSAKGENFAQTCTVSVQKIMEFRIIVYLVYSYFHTTLVASFPYFLKVYNYGIRIKSFLNTSSKGENFVQICTVSVQVYGA